MRDCSTVYLGTVNPLISFERLWQAYEPYMSNVYSIAVIASLGHNLDFVTSWLLSPNHMHRFLTIQSGSADSYRLCMHIHKAFLTLETPLSHRINIIIWNEYTKWSISTQAALELYSITTHPFQPLEFLLFSPRGLTGTHPGSTMLRISPRI